MTDTKTKRPVLGIICCNRPVGGQPAQSVITRYIISSLTYADASGLLIPAMPGLVDARDVARRLDGLLLTGTPSNVAPARYGDMVEEPPGPFDPERDEMTARLIDAMIAEGKAVFGICRGFQELNVAFGGTLRRDMAEHPDLIAHHAPDSAAHDDMFAHVHPVELKQGGVLRQAYGQDSIDVVSVHYQGADKVGPGLTVEATAPDGVVEAVSAEINGATVLAVQWHPEWRSNENPQSQLFFKLLGRALRGEKLAGGKNQMVQG